MPRLCRNVFAREYNDRSNLVSLWIYWDCHNVWEAFGNDKWGLRHSLMRRNDKIVGFIQFCKGLTSMIAWWIPAPWKRLKYKAQTAWSIVIARDGGRYQLISNLRNGRQKALILFILKRDLVFRGQFALVNKLLKLRQNIIHLPTPDDVNCSTWPSFANNHWLYVLRFFW